MELTYTQKKIQEALWQFLAKPTVLVSEESRSEYSDSDHENDDSNQNEAQHNKAVKFIEYQEEPVMTQVVSVDTAHMTEIKKGDEALSAKRIRRECANIARTRILDGFINKKL